MSLRRKITIIFLGLIIGFTLLVSSIVYLNARQSINKIVDLQLANHAENILNYVEPDRGGLYELPGLKIDFTENVIYQIWDTNEVLISSSAHAEQLALISFFNLPQNSQMVYRDGDLQGKPFRLLMNPIKSDNKPIAYLIVGTNLQPIIQTQRDLFSRIILVDLIISLVASALIAYILSKGLKPLHYITYFADSIINSEKLSERIPLEVAKTKEVKQMVQALNKSLDQLDNLFQSQKNLMSAVSHELRTPLTVIKGNIGLMRLIKKFDEESLTEIEKEIDRLSRMVSDLLLFAQANVQDISLHMQSLDLEELFLDVYEQINILSAGKHHVEIVELEPAPIVADPDRIKQVLLNLGHNALKFTPAGGWIQLGLRREEDHVIIYVSDTGSGIPKEDLSHIFELSYSGDNSKIKTGLEKGYGLGLPISSFFVQKHNGKIVVNSEPGKGSTFCVFLPLKLEVARNEELNLK